MVERVDDRREGLMSEDIVVVDDFLPIDAYETLARFISNEPMSYGSRSNSRTDPHGHWARNFVAAGRLNLADVSGDLQEKEGAAPINFTWKFLRERHLENDILIRCYLNGYTYGTEGYFHTDSDRPDEHTTILYMNDDWDPDWAGESVFLGRDGDIVKSVLPRRNRAIIFPANVQHAGRSVSRKCMVLRKTLIFKTRRRRSSDFEHLSAFLRKVGAGNLRHGAGTLHDHLVRTFSILETKDFPSSVCLGGGLHSIYGTNAFVRPILKPSARDQVASEFGAYAEQLAGLFSALERPQTLESPLDLKPDSVVVETRDGQKLVLQRDTFDDLRKIECANQIDQNTLGKYQALGRFWKGVS
jgi:hypothetical protein